MSVRQLSIWDEYRIWITSAETELKMDLVTYYGACAAVGAVQGAWIGDTIACYLRAVGY